MIAIENVNTGELQFVDTLEGYGEDWRQRGDPLPDDVDPHLAIEIDGRWIDDPFRVGEALIVALKQEAEQKKMAAITRGWAKSAEYQDKGAALSAAEGMTDSEIDALTDGDLHARFPAVWTERALSAEPASVILARYRRGAGGSMPELRRLSSIEQAVCRAIDRAEDANAKRDAAAAVDWDWQPPTM